jgi:hypothetical protein
MAATASAPISRDARPMGTPAQWRIIAQSIIVARRLTVGWMPTPMWAAAGSRHSGLNGVTDGSQRILRSCQAFDHGADRSS